MPVILSMSPGNGGSILPNSVTLSSPMTARAESALNIPAPAPPIMNTLPPPLDGPSISSAGVVGASPPSSTVSGVGPPSYPPTQVKQWLTCPVFWQLLKQWEPRVEAWTPHKLVGSAIHVGIAARLLDDPSSSDKALKVLGEGYVEQDTWALEGLQGLVQKGLQRLWRLIESEILPGTRIVAVELEILQRDARAAQGRTRRIVDLVLERSQVLEVWDWKTKIRLEDIYLGETQRAVLHSWQLLDYSWHVSQWFDRPISLVGHGLVILGPKLTAQAIPITLTPARLTQWRQDAQVIWAQMWAMDPVNQWGRSATASLPWHNWEACSDRHLHYGKECQFVPACHHLCGDESLFSGVFKRRGEAHG